ncbi:transcription elongation factor SPT6 homolog [Glycine max]|uniref:transcription elongation factor SPT6 homolog n=1 Tax=Glycine max TaxID=3847 RepID=UPI001B35711E|nr:transcription elongation factor SPT6 homolog [Glycine max]KAG4910120.1 hypothetical protein JHK87_056236 [Glycine soja]
MAMQMAGLHLVGVLIAYEGQDEYENDGFIMDKDEEEDEKEDRAESDDEPQKKKKRKKKEEYVLDEDDYELLEDNNINIHRRKVLNFLYMCFNFFFINVGFQWINTMLYIKIY